MNIIKKNKPLKPVNSLKPAKSKKQYTKIKLTNEGRTFIVLAFILILFFIFMLWLLITGFHAVDSGWTYNGGLKRISFMFILNLI